MVERDVITKKRTIASLLPEFHIKRADVTSCIYHPCSLVFKQHYLFCGEGSGAVVADYQN